MCDSLEYNQSVQSLSKETTNKLGRINNNNI